MLDVSGTLIVSGAISGAGILKVGGAADIATATAINVSLFAGGELKLGDSQAYAGDIRGFSRQGANSLDLQDIAFGGSTTASFSGTAASGVLTVTDGTHTAKITLIGDYLASTFTLASDGSGGTLVTDPPKTAALATAMAGFGPGSAAGAAAGASAHPPPSPLASPHG